MVHKLTLGLHLITKLLGLCMPNYAAIMLLLNVYYAIIMLLLIVKVYYAAIKFLLLEEGLL